MTVRMVPLCATDPASAGSNWLAVRLAYASKFKRPTGPTTRLRARQLGSGVLSPIPVAPPSPVPRRSHVCVATSTGEFASVGTSLRARTALSGATSPQAAAASSAVSAAPISLAAPNLTSNRRRAHRAGCLWTTQSPGSAAQYAILARRRGTRSGGPSDLRCKQACVRPSAKKANRPFALCRSGGPNRRLLRERRAPSAADGARMWP